MLSAHTAPSIDPEPGHSISDPSSPQSAQRISLQHIMQSARISNAQCTMRITHQSRRAGPGPRRAPSSGRTAAGCRYCRYCRNCRKCRYCRYVIVDIIDIHLGCEDGGVARVHPVAELQQVHWQQGQHLQHWANIFPSNIFGLG